MVKSRDAQYLSVGHNRIENGNYVLFIYRKLQTIKSQIHTARLVVLLTSYQRDVFMSKLKTASLVWMFFTLSESDCRIVNLHTIVSHHRVRAAVLSNRHLRTTGSYTVHRQLIKWHIWRPATLHQVAASFQICPRLPSMITAHIQSLIDVKVSNVSYTTDIWTLDVSPVSIPVFMAWWLDDDSVAEGVLHIYCKALVEEGHEGCVAEPGLNVPLFFL